MAQGDKTLVEYGASPRLVPARDLEDFMRGANFEPAAPATPARRQLLEESADLIDGDRNKNYGSPVANFANTAKLLNARFEHMFKEGMAFTAADVATIQILTKISRMVTSPNKKDHWLDIAGYAGCGWETIEAGTSEA